MPRPAVFFDRDNTLIASADYLGDPEGVVLLDGAAEAVARVRALGFATIVVSNQSGVARGLFSERDVRAVNARVDRVLASAHPDALIESHEFSPHHPDATVDEYRGEHRRRKPQPGMILDAADQYGLDLARSWVIGDAPRDVEAGRRAGCRTILVRERLERASPAAAEPMRFEPDYVASSLMDAVDFIEMHVANDAAPGAPESAEPTVFSTSEATVAAVADEPDAEPLVAVVEPEEVVTADAGPAGLPVDHPVASVASHLGLMKDAISSTAAPATADRQTVLLLERVVDELRRANDPPQDFSVARMLAGVVQGFAIASMFAALLFRDSPSMFTPLMMLAIFLQAMVSSLVLMGR